MELFCQFRTYCEEEINEKIKVLSSTAAVVADYIGETTGGAGGARHPLEFQCIAVNEEWMNYFFFSKP